MRDKLVQMALDAGANNAAVIDAKKIPFHRDFRALCEQNACGKFGRCWMCPPDVGDIDALMEKAKQFEQALVMQTVSPLEDSFDIDGMEAGAKHHNTVTQLLSNDVLPLLGPALRLGAGACQVCERCAKLDDEPCREPEKAIASLEAHGVAVSELAAICGMNYINGQNTVTYFSAFLYG